LAWSDHVHVAVYADNVCSLFKC